MPVTFAFVAQKGGVGKSTLPSPILLVAPDAWLPIRTAVPQQPARAHQPRRHGACNLM